MNIKIENQATVILLEILGILGVDTIIKAFEEKEDASVEEQGYFIINYLFRNIRTIQPQLEELVDLLVEEDVSILKGVAIIKDDEAIMNFFTRSLGEVMRSV